MPYGISHPYYLDESISILSVLGQYVSISFKFVHSVSKNSTEPDQTLHVAASEQVLHCLSMSHKKHHRHKWVTSKANYWVILILFG